MKFAYVVAGVAALALAVDTADAKLWSQSSTAGARKKSVANRATVSQWDAADNDDDWFGELSAPSSSRAASSWSKPQWDNAPVTRSKYGSARRYDSHDSEPLFNDDLFQYDRPATVSRSRKPAAVTHSRKYSAGVAKTTKARSSGRMTSNAASAWRPRGSTAAKSASSRYGYAAPMSAEAAPETDAKTASTGAAPVVVPVIAVCSILLLAAGGTYAYRRRTSSLSASHKGLDAANARTTTGDFGSAPEAEVSEFEMGQTVTVRTPYVSQRIDELTVEYRDEVLIRNIFSDGWALGEVIGSGNVGMFPLCMCSKQQTSLPKVPEAASA